MAIYESSSSAASRKESSSSSLLTLVVKALVGSPVLRMLYGATATTPDPYARMIRNNDRKPSSFSTTRTIGFWICFAAVAVVYSKRNISVDVWQSILKPPPLSPKKRSRAVTTGSKNDTIPTVEAVQVVYAICRKLLRYAVDTLKISSTSSSTHHPREPHDVSPTQHRGSCHCGNVKFVIFGPKTLYVESCTTTTTEAPYRRRRRVLSYEYARIDITALTWEEGNVQSYDDSSRYFFCPNCGVHLAHTATFMSTTNDYPDDEMVLQLFINVNCLDGNSYILRPIHSRPAEAIKPKHHPLTVPLTVPIPVVVDHHHPGIVPDRASIVSKNQQNPPSSPSISALDDDLELLSAADDRITLGAAASVTSVQTTEELAVTAYRLRKALSSHSSTTKSSFPRVTSHTECGEEEVAVEEDENPHSIPAVSPISESLPQASIHLLHSDEESSSTAAADADTLRRFLGKHVR